MSLDAFTTRYGPDGDPIFTGTAIPTANDLGGVAAPVGAIVINNTPSATAPIGWICTVAGKPGTWLPLAAPTQMTLVAITADGAVDPHTSKDYIITKAGVAAMTLAAPTAGTDDGITISIKSSTAFAHTLTATGLLQTGSANANVATFAAFAGAGLTLRAYNGKWLVLTQVGITFS